MGHSLLTPGWSDRQEAYLGVTGNSLSKGLKVKTKIINQERDKVSVAGPGPVAKTASVSVVKGVGDGTCVTACLGGSHMKAPCHWPPCAVRKQPRKLRGYPPPYALSEMGTRRRQ